MQLKRYLLVSFFIFFLVGQVLAQKKYSSNNQDYTCVVMQKKNYVGGIGFRAGDPLGATMKVYFLKRFAAEAIAGFAMGGINGKFHEKTFWRNNNPEEVQYLGHEIVYSYGFHARLLMHSQISRGPKGMDWYWGVGAQMRLIEAKYDYFIKTDKSKLQRNIILTKDLGPELVAGVEFAFPRSPFSAFGEVSLFAKVNESRKFVLPQGGLGIRLNF